MTNASTAAQAVQEPSPSEEPTINMEDRAVRAARRREKRRHRNARAEWWSTKLHAIIWVISSVIAFIVSDIVNVCLNSDDVNRWSVNIGLVLFGLVVLGVVRMAFWFPKASDDAADQAEFEKAHPNFTLAVTFGGIFSFLFLTGGLWPIYRIFAPFLLILLWFGMIMSLHFVP